MVCQPCIYKMLRCSGSIKAQMEAIDYALGQIGSTTPGFAGTEAEDFRHDLEVIEASVESLAETIQAKLEQTEENQD